MVTGMKEHGFLIAWKAEAALIIPMAIDTRVIGKVISEMDKVLTAIPMGTNMLESGRIMSGWARENSHM